MQLLLILLEVATRFLPGRDGLIRIVAVAVPTVIYGSIYPKGKAAVAAAWILWTFGLAMKMAALVLLALLAELVRKQRDFLYHPQPDGMERSTAKNPHDFQHPGRFKMPYRDVRLPMHDGVKVQVWFITHPEAVATWIFWHGNAGNIGHRLDNYHAVWRRCKVNIACVEYRGYGDSEDGKICESNWVKDAVAVYKWVEQQSEVDPSRIFLFGRSLGGAVALAAADKLGETGVYPAAIILENTFISIAVMGTAFFSFLQPLRLILHWPLVFDTWNNLWRIKRIAGRSPIPFLFLSGAKDTLVAPVQMHQLHAAALEARKKRDGPLVQFTSIPNGGHNDTPAQGGAMYWSALCDFHRAVLPVATPRSRASSPAAGAVDSDDEDGPRQRGSAIPEMPDIR